MFRQIRLRYRRQALFEKRRVHKDWGWMAFAPPPWFCVRPPPFMRGGTALDRMSAPRQMKLLTDGVEFCPDNTRIVSRQASTHAKGFVTNLLTSY
ncbi:hypothetical protein AVEN_266812-1 [Araneus ventricosus]|uniref:Uncharacterized protein n=1 Tax=Araneus ventricosus TaxID=182803 RepID=A0A4Y2HCY5_ARAVE|nr:hypothetical protein AVEN_266812-1 [Araneus ventricosus]